MSMLPSAKMRCKSSSGVSTFDAPATRWPDFDPGRPPWAIRACYHQDRRRKDRLAARMDQLVLRLPNHMNVSQM